MNCRNCGIMLSDDDKFCKNCGAPVNTDVAQNGMGYNNGYGNYGQQGMEQNGGYGQQGMQNGGYGQPVGQNYGNNMNYGQPPKKGNGVVIVIAVLLFLVVVAAVGFLSYRDKLNDKKGANDSSNKSKTEATNDKTEEVSTSTSYKVNMGNYTFEVPDTYTYDLTEDMLRIYNKDKTWLLQIEAANDSFEEIKTYQSLLKGTFENATCTISKVESKTVAGKEYIIMEGTESGDNIIAAIGAIGEEHIFFAQIYNVNNDFDYSILEEVTPILSNITYTEPATTSTTMNIKSKSNINMDTMLDAVKDAKDKKKK